MDLNTGWITAAIAWFLLFLFGKKPLQERFRKQLDDDRDRKRYAAELREDRFFPGLDGGRYGELDYRLRLRAILNLVDRTLGPKLLLNARGFGFCIVLSLGYCSLFFLTGWLLGFSTSVPFFSVLPVSWDWWRRGLLLLIYIGEATAIFRLLSTNASTAAARVRSLSAATIVWAAALISIQVLVSGGLEEAFLNIDIFSTSAALLGLIVGLSAALFALLLSPSGTIVGQITLGVAALSVLSWHLGLFPDLDPIAFLFLAGLPFVNSLFDWPSWAISRWLMKKLAAQPITLGRLLQHVLLDLFAALLLLFGLAAVLPAVVVVLRAGLPIESTVTEVIRDPLGSGSWVLLMLLSTLIPTAAHVIAVVLSAVTCRLPTRAREAHAQKLDPRPFINEPSSRDLDDASQFLVLRWFYAGLVVIAVLTALWIPIRVSATPIAELLAQVAIASGNSFRTSESVAAEAYLHAGRAKILALNHSRHEEALSILAEARKHSVEEPELLNLLGITLHELDRLDEAVVLKLRAVELEPSNALYLYSLGITLHYLQRLDESLIAHQAAVRIDPREAFYYHGLASVLHDLGRLDESLINRQKAVEIEPTNAVFLSGLGATLHALGRLDKAVVEEGRAVELAPKNSFFLNNLGVSLHELGRLDEAVVLKQQAIEFEPGNSDFVNSLAISLYQLGRFDEALEAIQRAIEMAPDEADSFGVLAVTLHSLDRPAEALVAGRRAVEMQPDRASNHEILGTILHDLGFFDEALEIRDRAAELKPGSVSCRRNLGATLRALGRLDEALTTLIAALDLDDTSAWLQHDIAVVLEEKGQTKEALARFEQAIRIEPDEAHFHSHASQTLSALGYAENALLTIEHALELEPENPDYWHSKASQLALAQQTEEALSAIESALFLSPGWSHYLEDRTRYLRLLERAENERATDAARNGKPEEETDEPHEAFSEHRF